MHRDVVIVGYRLNAKEPAPRALARILGLSPEAARKLARSFPAVVGTALPEPEAAQLAAMLRDAGAQVELREGAGGAQPAGAGQLRAGTERPSSGQLHAASVAPRMPPRAPAPPEPPRARPADAVDDDGLEAGSVTAAYRLGDFGLAPPPPPTAPKPPPAPTEPAAEAPAPPAKAPPPRAPGDDLSFDLDFNAGPALELEDAANSNARAPVHPSAPPDLDDRFALSTHDAPAPAPAVEERAYRAVQQRAPRTSVHAPRRSNPVPVPTAPSRSRGARVVRQAQGWLPSLLLLALLSLGTLIAVGYALDPDHAFALLAPPEAPPELATPTTAENDARHPLLRSAPATLRAPLTAILRARVAGVHALPTTFPGKDGKVVECVLVEQRTPDEDVGARLDELRRTGSEVAPPRGAEAALREHARLLSAAAGKPLNLTPLCLGP